jgi:hypothetical protein
MSGVLSNEYSVLETPLSTTTQHCDLKTWIPRQFPRSQIQDQYLSPRRIQDQYLSPRRKSLLPGLSFKSR